MDDLVIASSLPVDAARVIDAGGLALMPGIIDSHPRFVRMSPGIRMCSCRPGSASPRR